ncbi:MAG: hypothetical protein LZ174_01510 [Thaumarchaeota archaeon]|nr:hypothetical protein [Candidatus Geocrenenecus arthurdayi]
MHHTCSPRAWMRVVMHPCLQLWMRGRFTAGYMYGAVALEWAFLGPRLRPRLACGHAIPWTPCLLADEQ